MPPKGSKKKKFEGTVYYLNPLDATAQNPQQVMPNLNTNYNQIPLILSNRPSPIFKQEEIQPIKRDVNGISSLLNVCVSMGDVDLDISEAAFTLDEMKRHKNEILSKPSDKPQRYLINRSIPEKYETISEVGSFERVASIKDSEQENSSVGSPQIPLKKIPPFKLYSHGTDIAFSNGNNRERRRGELFGCYSSIYKYKEENREQLYLHQRKKYEDRIKKLSIPRNPNTEISTSYTSDIELFDSEQDIIELRDYELTRLKSWRSFRRDENLKTYYNDSMKVYKNANDLLYDNLEKLKSFFLRQKALLTNLDRDFSEIGSARAEKFYSGFLLHSNNQQLIELKSPSSSVTNDQMEVDSNADNDSNGSNNEVSASETDGASSGSKRKSRKGYAKASRISKPDHNSQHSIHGNQILSSILEGFAPLLTDSEFKIVTGDELSNRYSFNGANSSLMMDRKPDSDTDGSTTATNTTSVKKRNVGRPSKSLNGNDSNGNNTRENTAALNKIMKQYIPPDNLKPTEVEEDLELLRNKTK